MVIGLARSSSYSCCIQSPSKIDLESHKFLKRISRLRYLPNTKFLLFPVHSKRSILSVKAEMEAKNHPLTENTKDVESMYLFGDSVKNALLSPINESVSHQFKEKKTFSKVTVVGVGNVGMACAQTILTESLVEEIALVDVQVDKLKGEMLDLQHAAAFLSRVRIIADTDYAVTAGSQLCIVTAGARQREGESRLSLIDRNVALFKSIIPKLVQYSPDTILLIISNPVDILTWVAWKISGLPSNRVIGSGTNLDSSRFRFLIANSLNLNAQNVHANIIGEHGDSSVPLWSSVSIAGVPMAQFLGAQRVSECEQVLECIHKKVVDSAYEVIRLKGYTSWAIGYSVASLTRTVLRNQRRVQPLSVLAKGHYGIKEEVYLSLPSLLGSDGAMNVVNIPLNEDEKEKLLKSASVLWEIQKNIQI